MPWDLVIFVMCLGLWFGYELLCMATMVVEIASATLFVSFAAHPWILAETQPEIHKGSKQQQTWLHIYWKCEKIYMRDETHAIVALVLVTCQSLATSDISYSSDKI